MRLNAIARGLVYFIIGTLLFWGTALAQCPPKEQIEAVISKFEAQDRSLVAIQPTEYPGLCEVQVGFQGQPSILYTDAAGAYGFQPAPGLRLPLAGDLTREKIDAAFPAPTARARRIPPTRSASSHASGKRRTSRFGTI